MSEAIVGLAKKLALRRPYVQWEDLASEAELLVLEEHLEGEAAFKAARKVMNKIINRERRRAFNSIPFEDLDDHVDEILDDDFLMRYAECLSGDPNGTVLALARTGLGAPEIAEITGMRRATVKLMLKEEGYEE